MVKGHGGLRKFIFLPLSMIWIDFWALRSYRYQLEAFVDKVRGRTPQHWFDESESFAQMYWVEQIYKKVRSIIAYFPLPFQSWRPVFIGWAALTPLVWFWAELVERHKPDQAVLLERIDGYGSFASTSFRTECIGIIEYCSFVCYQSQCLDPPLLRPLAIERRLL